VNDVKWHTDASVVDFGTVMLQLVFSDVTSASGDTSGRRAAVLWSAVFADALLVISTFPPLHIQFLSSCYHVTPRGVGYVPHKLPSE